MTRIYFFKTAVSGSKKGLKNTVSQQAKQKLLEIASNALETSFDDLKIEKTENGKPFFKAYPDFHFNLSHSKNAFAIAVSDHPVGIDIEELKNPDLAVAKRFFSEQEMDYVNLSPAPNFFEIWTKKEAFIKRFGLTLKDLKNAETNDIFTTQKENFIISVCGEDNDIIFENLN